MKQKQITQNNSNDPISLHRFYVLATAILLVFFFESCIIDKTNEEVIIAGRITDSSEVAIQGVSVDIELVSEKITTQTSTDGIFSVHIPHGGAAHVTFSKEGYTPQLVKIALKNGASKTIDVQMNTLDQDAFFEANIKSKTLPNTQGDLSVHISTNISFEVECAEEWINCQKNDNNLYIRYKENEIQSIRVAVIKLTAEYGHYREITLTQIEGPVLRLIDYTGNGNRADFPSRDPFIQLNREVKLISIESSVEGINLSPQYSDDKTTITFPELKIPAFEEVRFNYEVQSTDSAVIKGSFFLKLYKSVTHFNPVGGYKILFMKDNQSFWLNTSNYSNQSYVQYSIENLRVMNTLPPQQAYTDFFYNSYNNCLYVMRNYDVNNYKTDIYNAATGAFVEQLDFSSDRILITQMAFGNNGFGLMQETTYSIIYSINSANNHDYKLFNNNIRNIINRMRACNNGKFLFLDSSVNYDPVFTVNVDTKELKNYSEEGNNGSVNYSLPGVLWVSNYTKQLTYLNLETQQKINIQVQYPGWSAVQLVSEDSTFPWALTSDLSLINLQSGEEKKFEYTSELWPFDSSNDGKIVVIGNRNKLYLFSSETFIKYNSKIK